MLSFTPKLKVQPFIFSRTRDRWKQSEYQHYKEELFHLTMGVTSEHTSSHCEMSKTPLNSIDGLGLQPLVFLSYIYKAQYSSNPLASRRSKACRYVNRVKQAHWHNIKMAAANDVWSLFWAHSFWAGQPAILNNELWPDTSCQIIQMKRTNWAF